MYIDWVKSLSLILYSLLLIEPAQSQNTQSPDVPQKIILIGSEEQTEELDELKNVIGLHIDDLKTNVEIVITEQKSSNILEQVEIIRSLLKTSPAFSAIWIESSKNEVFLFMSNKNSDRVFLHTIPFEEGGWVAKCDTIAVLVRSALITWFDTPAEEPLAKETESKSPSEMPVKNRPGFFVDAGYSLGLLHPKESPVHGAQIRLGVLLGKHIEIRLSTRLFQKLELPISEMNIAFHRIPSVLSLGARWPLGLHEIGLHAGLVVDATYLRGISASQTRDETTLVNFGFTPSISYRLSIWRFLSLWLDVGPEFYFHTYNYTFRGEPVLDYSAVQGRASIGLVFTMSGI